MKTLIAMLICTSLLGAAENQPRPRWRTILYRSSMVALTAANAIDIGSSWGGREQTPFLRSQDGRFGARGTGIKLGMLAAIITSEAWLVRKQPNADLAASSLNLAMAAAMSHVAANNFRIKSASK